MTAYTLKDSNIAKTWVLMTLFLVGVVFVGWMLAYAYQDQSFLYGAIIISLIANISSYWYADKVALAVSRAHLADEKNYLQLHHLVENLSITAGIQKPAVYIINDSSPNAFATGRNPKHSSLAFTTGLLERLEKTELEGVVAHELSHVKNYDILLSTAVVVLVGIISMMTDFFMRSLWWKGSSRDDKNNQVGNLFMIIGIALAIVAPILATLVQLAISRKRELLADASGVLLTRYPEGLANALEKISTAAPLAHATNATAHLFIANPFKADVTGNKKTPWMARLFMTHPPIEERIAALRAMN